LNQEGIIMEDQRYNKRYPLSVAVVIASVLVVIAACSDSIVSDIPDDTQPVAARFSEIEQRVFAVSCALSGCHVGPTPQAGMDLSAGKAYSSIVNVPSLFYPNQSRVQPGDAEASVLLQVLRRQLQPVMPPTGPLSSAIVDSIAVWIDSGAEMN